MRIKGLPGKVQCRRTAPGRELCYILWRRPLEAHRGYSEAPGQSVGMRRLQARRRAGIQARSKRRRGLGKMKIFGELSSNPLSDMRGRELTVLLKSVYSLGL